MDYQVSLAPFFDRMERIRELRAILESGEQNHQRINIEAVIKMYKSNKLANPARNLVYVQEGVIIPKITSEVVRRRRYRLFHTL
jgi:hypothetical protein